MLRQSERERKQGVLYCAASQIPSLRSHRRRAFVPDIATHTDEFVIKGVTAEGKPFRPSDWAERLCGVMSAFGGDHRMQYSPYVQPVTSAGVKCVVVSVGLKEIEPMAWNFLMSFARDNELQIRPGRGVKRPEDGQEASPAATG